MARLLQSIDDSYHNAPSRSLVSPFPLATARIRPPSAAILGTSVGNGKGNDRRGERRRPEADTPPRRTPCLHQATSRSACGVFSAISSSVRAAPEGARRPCSHTHRHAEQLGEPRLRQTRLLSDGCDRRDLHHPSVLAAFELPNRNSHH